jgi:hypothetical protein
MGSRVVRLPLSEYKEIKEIERRLNCSFGYAFKQWKKKISGIKWEESF